MYRPRVLMRDLLGDSGLLEPRLVLEIRGALRGEGGLREVDIYYGSA